MKSTPTLSLVALSLLLGVGCAGARPAPVDRTTMPAPGPVKPFTPPTVQRTTLSNGLSVMLTENHEIPLVGMALVVGGGSAVDPVGKEGLASLTAAMLQRGTTRMDALALGDAFQFLGTDIGAGADHDYSVVSMVSLTRNLDASLGLMADMVTSPAMSEEELARERAQTVTAIAASKDRAEVLADLAFHHLLYGPVYKGRSEYGTEASVGALTRQDVVDFHSTWYRPNNATLIVAGDLTMEQAVPVLEKALGGWQKGATPEVKIALPAAPTRTTVYLMDRPGSAQSQLRVGTLGITRGSPDFPAAYLWNLVLGGSFQARINLNLRESKGYTYGASSGFDAGPLPGPFVVSTGVKSAVTAPAVVEIVKEITEIGTTRPPTAEEIQTGRDFVDRRFPAGFESISDMLIRLQIIAVNQLPDDYFLKFVQQIKAVPPEAILAQSQKVPPSALLIVVVGDRATCEAPLKEAGFEVVMIDREGKVLP